MAFVERQIDLQFSNPEGITTLKGLRVHALIANLGGQNGSGTLQLRVWGMTIADMNRYSGVGSSALQMNNLTSVTVSAGNVGGPISQIFEGSLYAAYIDMSEAPDVCFVIAAISGLLHKGTPSKSIQFVGAANAEEIIKGLAGSIGLQFVNANGAHAVLRDQHLPVASVIDQMQQVATAAGFPLVIENNTVTIWPNNGLRDNITIDIGPKTGLVGYPGYQEVGLLVKSEFNPLLRNGRQVNLTSSIPKANGAFPIQTVTHELATQSQDAPWFSTCTLAASFFVPRN